jgi:hypothetical protein
MFMNPNTASLLVYVDVVSLLLYTVVTILLFYCIADAADSRSLSFIQLFHIFLLMELLDIFNQSTPLVALFLLKPNFEPSQ